MKKYFVFLAMILIVSTWSSGTLALALPPNGLRSALLTEPNVSVNFRDRIESLTACTVFYEIAATGRAAYRQGDVMQDSIPLYIHIATPEAFVPQGFYYRASLRNLSENGRIVFFPINSSFGPRALLRINCWMDPRDRYILSVQCPPSWKSGIWKDWKPQLWSTFRASHSQFYDRLINHL